ncbi:hypothetical protein FHX80_1369 [Streptomyces brevispora]|uniref:Uncharacterized protein n=1 Tax=Streptomyces brevispora TaxID=887462 RepID=A0A561TUA2_9ACTN|nr:hypothetical protein FHX80_1369 [Streptomyces brevispora]
MRPLYVHADGKHAVNVSFPRQTHVDMLRCKLPDVGWSRPRSSAMFNSASAPIADTFSPSVVEATVVAWADLTNRDLATIGSMVARRRSPSTCQVGPPKTMLSTSRSVAAVHTPGRCATPGAR